MYSIFQRLALAGTFFLFSLALTASGMTTVHAWGNNQFHQTELPNGLTNVVGLAAGSVHTLALRADGTVTAWGAGTNLIASGFDYGQSLVPAGLKDVIGIAAGLDFSAALKSDGNITTWGHFTPSLIKPQATMLSAGRDHLLILDNNGRLSSWPGNTALRPSHETFSRIVGLAAGEFAAAGQDIALLEDGTAARFSSATSVPIPGVTNAVAISAPWFGGLVLPGLTPAPSGTYPDGELFVLLENGTVGRITDRTPNRMTTLPGITNVAAISAGGDVGSHLLILRRDGTVSRWSSQGFGTDESVAGLTNVFAIASGHWGGVSAEHNVAVAGNGAPMITVNPWSRTVRAGTTLGLTVMAVGSPPLTYRWQRNGIDLIDDGRITAVTDSRLILRDVLTSDGGEFRVIVQNGNGSVTSSPAATLTVLEPPSVQIVPASATVAEHQNTSFSATITGSAPLSLQWYFDGQPLTDGLRPSGSQVGGSHTPWLVVSMVTTNDSGIYLLEVRNAAGAATSGPVNLNVVVPPRFTIGPELPDYRIDIGSNVTLPPVGVKVSGTPPMAFQWAINQGAGWKDLADSPPHIIGAREFNLRITDFQPGNAGLYRLTASNIAGTASHTMNYFLNTDLLSVLPATNGAVTGPPGGPFTPLTTSYLLTNASSTASVPYSALVSAGSLLLLDGERALSGSLAPNGTRSIKVTLDPAINTLNPGSYNFTFLVSVDHYQGRQFPRQITVTIAQPSITRLSRTNGPTTGVENGTRVQVRLHGSSLHPATPVQIGGIPAPVVGSAPDNSYLDVELPSRAPGCDCATVTNLPVEISIGYTSVSYPFTYNVVRVPVPARYKTIQEAVTSSIPGECIVVAAGDYINTVPTSPLIHFRPDARPRNDITVAGLTGSDGLGATLWGGRRQSSTSPVVIFDGNNEHTVLTGFEIILGNGAIAVANGARPLIRRNLLDNNSAAGNGGGIRVDSAAFPTLLENHIAFNSALGNGGGVWIENAGALVLSNSIAGNLGAAGGGVYARQGSVTLTRNIIEHNQASGPGGGVWLGPTNLIELRANRIQMNHSKSLGGGIYVETDAAVKLIYNTIAGNESAGNGGGLYASSAAPEAPPFLLELNSILGNIAARGSSGGGAFLSGVEPQFVNNVISSNQATGGAFATGGGVFLDAFTEGFLSENTLTHNSAQIAGAISIGRKSRTKLIRNLIAFNSARQTVEDADDDVDFYAPGLFVDDAGPRVINNIFHRNECGRPLTGAIHIVDPGVFRPRWYHNIFTYNSGWGVFCATPNNGVTLDHNDAYGNTSGGLCSSSALANPTSAGNIEANPLYQFPDRLDFRLQLGSPARNAGDPLAPRDPDGTIADLGALIADGVSVGSSSRIIDTASTATVVTYAGNSEVLVLVRNFSGRLPDGSQPMTPLVWVALEPPLAGPQTMVLDLPLIVYQPHNTLVDLMQYDPVTGDLRPTDTHGGVNHLGRAIVGGSGWFAETGWYVGVQGKPRLTISREAGTIVLTWTANGETLLQESEHPMGPWLDVRTNLNSGRYLVPAAQNNAYFRLSTMSDGNLQVGKLRTATPPRKTPPPEIEVQRPKKHPAPTRPAG